MDPFVREPGGPDLPRRRSRPGRLNTIEVAQGGTSGFPGGIAVHNPGPIEFITRRRFGQCIGAATLLAGSSGPAAKGGLFFPAIRVPAPSVTCGISVGDVEGDSAVVWARSDRASKMIVEWATNEAFRDVRRIEGPAALPESDFTAKARISGLPPGETIAYRVSFRDPDSAKVVGHPVEGRFRTAPAGRTGVSFAWGGDVAGQGWGIAPDRGGMATFAAIRRAEPDFFLHSGDHIYADNPIVAEVKLDEGTLWKNLITEETSKVAETLDEFRGRYRYNFLDAHFRDLFAHVPVLAQWDDHETLNNWYPGETLDADPRYRVKDVDLLSSRARRAFLDYLPIRATADDPGRIYRTVSYGPSLEVFLLDERSYRGPNSANRQPERGPATGFLGVAQLSWLKKALQESRATWKVIASDMPIGLVIGDGPDTFEGVSNGDGPPLGRELEIADLLRSIKTSGVKNVVWFTTDVHYAAAHHYDPSRARFTDFEPFWEFIAGPLHAGTFGPGKLDDTFGPERKFSAVPPGMKGNRPPSDGYQFFGLVKIAPGTEVMTVGLHDRYGKTLYKVDLPPA